MTGYHQPQIASLVALSHLSEDFFQADFRTHRILYVFYQVGRGASDQLLHIRIQASAVGIKNLLNLGNRNHGWQRNGTHMRTDGPQLLCGFDRADHSGSRSRSESSEGLSPKMLLQSLDTIPKYPTKPSFLRAPIYDGWLYNLRQLTNMTDLETAKQGFLMPNARHSSYCIALQPICDSSLRHVADVTLPRIFPTLDRPNER